MQMTDLARHITSIPVSLMDPSSLQFKLAEAHNWKTSLTIYEKQIKDDARVEQYEESRPNHDSKTRCMHLTERQYPLL